MKDLILKRNDLLNRSMELKRIINDDKVDYEKAIELRKKQDELYKEKIFFDNMIRRLNNVSQKRKTHTRR